MNDQSEPELSFATKNTYRLQEKTFTDPVIGTSRQKPKSQHSTS